VLAALREAGHDILLVVTQPDRPAGRGRRLEVGAVKKFALEYALPVFQPDTLNSVESLARLEEVRPDALVVAAYGSILSARALEVARHGAFNVHASLLPRWRGAAPIQRAILAGDAQTGISIMKMDAGLDTGPVLSQQAIAIAARETAGSLEDALASLGANMMVQVLGDLQAGRAVAIPQPEQGVTYAHKITKEDALLDWRRSALELDRQVRALAPSPGAAAMLEGERVKIWQAQVIPREGAPGCVLQADDSGLVVACGESALHIIELQRAGGRRVPAADFLHGRPLSTSSRFE
jgi:methionyl-tRNA formyltransferase